MKIISSILIVEMVFICSAESTAQSFWKGYGKVTDTLALHSGILYSTNNNALFVSTYNRGIFKNEAKDSSWHHVLVLPKDQPLLSLYEANNGYLFAGGYGKIFRSDPSGEKWNEIPIHFTHVKNFAEDLNGSLFLCSADSGGILRSTDNGLTWQPFENGLPSKYVNNIAGDGHGNILCTLTNDRTNNYGGLFYLNHSTNQWVKTKITVKLDNIHYNVKVNIIPSITITAGGMVYLSLDGAILNFGLFGVFKNSVSGSLAGTLWQTESWNDTINSPITLRFDQIFASRTGHIFSSRISSSSPGVFSKMKYSSKWIDCNGGLTPAARVKAYFTEGTDGTVYITTDFSNRVFFTKESLPGKKSQNIQFGVLPPARLYESYPLTASSSSGLAVQFRSMNTDKARIDGNRITALGLGGVQIKAYAEGNEAYYYGEESQTLSIDKARNEIYVEPLPDITEGDSSLDVSARASSGEAVQLAVTHGNAWFRGNKIVYQGAGRIQFMATEAGNDTYEAADTVWKELCINPGKPDIIRDTLAGNIVLYSTVDTGNRWYLDNSSLNHEEKTLSPMYPGIYTVQVDIDGCLSSFSDPFFYQVTNIQQHAAAYPFIFYPQPSGDRLFIKLEETMAKGPVQITIMDCLGNIVLSQTGGTQTIITVDTGQLIPGWYILQVSVSDRKYYAKIITD